MSYYKKQFFIKTQYIQTWKRTSQELQRVNERVAYGVREGHDAVGVGRKGQDLAERVPGASPRIDPVHMPVSPKENWEQVSVAVASRIPFLSLHF
jgi:hypothetical protein